MDSCLLITAWNRASLLEVSLNRLNQLTKPDEVLVIDDGSSDHLKETCERIVTDVPIRYLWHNNPGQAMCAEARNIGIKNTDCDIIITSEPEMRFDTDIVAQFLAKHAELPSDCLNAGTIHHEHLHEPTTTTVNWHATWVSLYERQWLLDIGGWDEGFPDPWGWDDTDLVTRLVASGHGTTIMLECEATHQWHLPFPHRQDRNEAHFKSKLSDEGGCLEIVANAGRPWGVIKP